MSIADLGSLGELIGSLAVVVTLIFLTLQMRQNTSALESASESDAAMEFAGWNARMASDPTLIEMWEKAMGEETLSTVELARFRWIIAEFFYICEAQYRRRLRGLLTEETWQRQLDILIGFIRKKDIIDFWENYPVSPSFQRYVRSQLGSARETSYVPPIAALRE